MQERREDFARDRGRWRREKEMDLRKEKSRKQKPFHSTSSTLHHSDQKENLRTTFAKTNPKRENVRGRRRRRKAEEETPFLCLFPFKPSEEREPRFSFDWAPLNVLWTAH